VTGAVSYAGLGAVAALHDRSLLAQTTFQLTGADLVPGLLTLPPLVFRLFSGGPQLCPKFRASNISLIVNPEVHLGWRELLHVVRKVFTETENVLAKGKGGRGRVY
jgi:hypothetical protein